MHKIVSLSLFFFAKEVLRANLFRDIITISCGAHGDIYFLSVRPLKLIDGYSNLLHIHFIFNIQIFIPYEIRFNLAGSWSTVTWYVSPFCLKHTFCYLGG